MGSIEIGNLALQVGDIVLATIICAAAIGFAAYSWGKRNPPWEQDAPRYSHYGGGEDD